MEKTTFVAYDTLCSVSIRGPENREYDVLSLLAQSKQQALAVQDTLNMYDSDSELGRLCGRYTPGEPVVVSPMLHDFIRLNLTFARLTEGAFDFTVGPLVKLWNVLADDPEIPGENEIAAAKRRVGYQHVRLCCAPRAVIFDTPGMVLDPGASGKGYALELAVKLLKTAGVRSAVLDFGGNLFVMGQKQLTPGSSEPWRVAIRHPDKDRCLGTVLLADRGIATSSWYEHNFCKDGCVYHHLLDPFTGRPHEMGISSVSILSAQAIYTDLLSTAFFIMGLEAGCHLASQLKQQGVTVDYVVLMTDGTVKASAGAAFTLS